MKRTVEHQNQEAEPVSPRQLDKRSWKYVGVRTVRQFSAHQCVDAAAGLTFYAILSMFPALIAIFSLLGLIGQKGEAAKTVLDLIEEVAPAGTAETLRGPIEQFAQAPGAGIALIVGILVALWSASKYVAAFSRAMNRIYGVAEGRPFWKLRPMLLLVTLIGVLSLAFVILALVLSGDILQAVGNAIGASAGITLAWKILKWPLLVLVIVLLVAMLYYTTPNAKQPKFRWVSLGALLAIVLLALASFGFGIYVKNFSNYESTYGSMAGVVIFLFWVWIANIALLFGAEFDAELERGRQLESGIPAEEGIQLPLRDTQKILKQTEQDEALAAKGRDIRRASEGE